MLSIEFIIYLHLGCTWTWNTYNSSLYGGAP